MFFSGEGFFMEAIGAQVRRITATSTVMQKVALFCLLYSALAFALFPHTFLSVLGAYPILRFYVFLPLLFVVGLFTAALIHSPRRPLTFMWEKLRDRGKGAAAIMAILVISASAFTTLKHEYAFIVPFHADTTLAWLDGVIHFGDPWRWTHMVLPGFLEPPLYFLYSALWFVELGGTLVYAAFVANRQDRERFFTTFALSVILLSSVVRIAASSAGPIFYTRMIGADHFTDLMEVLRNSPAGPQTLKISDYLYDSYATHRTVLGTGISAMPSMHVALAFLNALFISSRSRMVGYVAWSYAALILFGSVHFGWHYALDGYVSILLVLLFWTAAGRSISVPARSPRDS
jgi:hypothetical protein